MLEPFDAVHKSQTLHVHAALHVHFTSAADISAHCIALLRLSMS